VNIAMVRRLIWKDWYLNRAAILASLIAGMTTLALVAASHVSDIVLILGMIVVVTILIGMGAVVMASAVRERKDQTLPFVMSLPITYVEYTTAKIVGSLLIFLVLWTALLADMVATILLVPGVPHGLIPFVVIMSVGVTQVGALSLNGIGWWIARMPAIGGAMRSATLRWSGTATALLAAELAAIALMIAITFIIQARKTDFI
jgi:ABC-2 type transport system permease protein